MRAIVVKLLYGRLPPCRVLTRVSGSVERAVVGNCRDFEGGNLTVFGRADFSFHVIVARKGRGREVVDAALEFNLSGKPREWRAPRGSIAVKVTPVKTYRNQEGIYYREFKMEVITDTRQSRINGLAYRTTGGKWATKVLYF